MYGMISFNPYFHLYCFLIRNLHVKTENRFFLFCKVGEVFRFDLLYGACIPQWLRQDVSFSLYFRFSGEMTFATSLFTFLSCTNEYRNKIFESF